MTTDRELLQLAAKAAGYKVHAALVEQRAIASPDAIALALSEPGNTWWNPLEDDGDALRLAVKLKLHVGYSGGNQYFAGPSDSDKGVMRESGEHSGKQDPAAATRRAIVRAAAAMPAAPVLGAA